MEIEKYIGKDISALLKDDIFKNWQYERTLETELDKLIIHYVFEERGLELRCDSNEVITVIFIAIDKFYVAEKSILGLLFSSNRKAVLNHFGSPFKSGGSINDPILRDYGMWDKFLISNFSVHVEYKVNLDEICKITLMKITIT